MSVDEVSTSKAAARIRSAAIEIFAAKGYGATSTREIAASLDLSPGAMYPHYKTKESLLFDASLDGHRRALAETKQADIETDTPPVRLASTVRAYVQFHARHHALARVIQYELRSLTPEHFRTIAAVRRNTSKVFTDIIGAGVVTKDFSIADTDAATLAITSLGIDVSRWFPSKSFSDPDVLASRYVELALRMVGAPPS
ncbi:TetR/AcrR family transcriptional regulator [Rhodococcus sp. H29-C3]|uniref:TetR/AcrR family transcriptional regulator n=1 Tax=Rhodococcus sp. H29-C3 TaxID=3046307 RepID=UPI0024BA5F9C|nr:TetR/AcrR family transcriptional regulator [Rhodococcus sp. H29-C3]MDJ0360533.1 TetR/AcrR family transcriptional regulator [Rhodococcus sp. H29-C3]